MLGVVNFAHGACYMLGAIAAAVLQDLLGLSFWWALLVVPVLLFLFGVLMERLFVRWLLALDPLYNFLLTFGLTLVLVDLVKRQYGVSGPAVHPARRSSTASSSSAACGCPPTRCSSSSSRCSCAWRCGWS